MIIRRISGSEKRVFLTFDDGPHPTLTQDVLDILRRHQAQATFFVVGNKARQHGALLKKIIVEGHGIGNHSLDHTYSVFFSSTLKMREWIEASETNLSRLAGDQSVGFRPPAGVCTPPLRSALKDLGIPLILWNTRFYDTVMTWSREKAQKSLTAAKSGDIVLLHDFLRDHLQRDFLSTLDFYLALGTSAGFKFEKLTKEMVLADHERP